MNEAEGISGDGATCGTAHRRAHDFRRTTPTRSPAMPRTRTPHITPARGELRDAGGRAVPRSGGRLSPGAGPRLDALPADVTTL
jgi:hypothetical protein